MERGRSWYKLQTCVPECCFIKLLSLSWVSLHSHKQPSKGRPLGGHLSAFRACAHWQQSSQGAQGRKQRGSQMLAHWSSCQPGGCGCSLWLCSILNSRAVQGLVCSLLVLAPFPVACFHGTKGCSEQGLLSLAFLWNPGPFSQGGTTHCEVGPLINHQSRKSPHACPQASLVGHFLN